MENIYANLAARTGGNIYIGVVGPVRTGKSTLIKRIMEQLVIPNITEAAMMTGLPFLSDGYDEQYVRSLMDGMLAFGAKTVVLTGATASKIKDAILSCDKYEGQIKIIEEPDFKNAVLMAHNEALSGDKVILSPACASFDAFPNFAARGKFFKEKVMSL